MSTALNESSVPALNSLFRLQYEEAQESWVLLYPEGMVRLNQSAAQIMQRCNGENTIGAIVKELEQVFNTSVLVSDVTGFVNVAVEQNWLKVEASS